MGLSMEETKCHKEQEVPGYPEYRPPKPKEEFPALPGIYLVEPHGKLIAERKKTAIVKSKEFKKYIGRDIYVCGDFVYAVIKLNKPYKIDLEQFEKLRDKHRISDEERKRWWPDKKSLYLYSFRIVKIFKKPLKYDRVPGVQVFIREVKPYRKNLKDIEVKPQYISDKDKVIKLLEITSVIKTFVVKNPFLFLTGGVVARKKTRGDFDILYRCESLPPDIIQKMRAEFLSGFNDDLKSRCHFMPDAYHGPFTSYIPLGRLQLTCSETKTEKGYMHIGPSGIEYGDDIYLENILKGFRSFVIEENFLWLVGELPKNGETKGYIDFVFKCPKMPSSLAIALKFRIWRALPKEYWHRIRYKFDPNFKPADTDICFGKLEFILNKKLNTIEMSLKNLMRKQRAASPEIRAEAKASAEEDKVKLFRFYLPLKPIRGYFPRERQTIDLFVSIVTDESKGTWYSTKKYDGLNLEFHYDKGKAKIISEDGEDNTDRFPELVEELEKLGADNFSVVAELELWKEVDGELKHQPREAVIGRVHRKGLPDETGLVANVYDITYLNGKDIHNEPFEKRLEALKTLKFPQATWRKPNLKYKLNRAPAVLSKTAEDIRKHTQFLRKLNGSEGNVIKLSSAKYRLDGKRSNQWKFHNSGVANVIVIEAIETKVKNIWNYLFGLDPQDEKVPEKLLVEIGGKKYFKVGKTFSSARPMKKGDVFILEYETLNLEQDEKTDEIKVTAWSPRELGKTDKKVDTIDSAVRKAKAGLVFQEKIIPVEGEIIYKVGLTSDLIKAFLQKIVDIKDYDPTKLRTRVIRDDWRIVTAWATWKMKHGQWKD